MYLNLGFCVKVHDEQEALVNVAFCAGWVVKDASYGDPYYYFNEAEIKSCISDVHSPAG